MDFLGLEWTRPWGLAALVLPLAVIVLARRRPTPWLAATGTLSLWRAAVQQHPHDGARRGGALPPAVWLQVAALTLGALALAGPEPAAAARPAWIVVVDRSPGMHLPLAAAGGPSRLGAATEQARRLLEREGVRAAQWLSYSREGREEVLAAGAPQAWLEAPLAPLPAPPWELLDRPGVLWVRDSAPAAGSVPRFAGWVASGGAAIPGAVATTATGRMHWDGALLRESEGGQAPTVFTQGLPEVIELFVSTWARARAVALTTQSAEASLQVVCKACATAAGVRVEAGRDGWRGTGPLAEGGGPEEGLDAWLVEPAAGTPLVSVRPGLVRLDWRLEELAGDPAAFAVSWTRLFDDALLPPADVVPLERRIAQGEASERVPAPPAPAHAPPGRAASALAALACACACASLLLVLLRRRRRGSTGALRPRRSAA